MSGSTSKHCSMRSRADSHIEAKYHSLGVDPGYDEIRVFNGGGQLFRVVRRHAGTHNSYACHVPLIREPYAQAWRV
jgi:hypothetical protein